MSSIVEKFREVYISMFKFYDDKEISKKKES